MQSCCFSLSLSLVSVSIKIKSALVESHDLNNRVCHIDFSFSVSRCNRIITEAAVGTYTLLVFVILSLLVSPPHTDSVSFAHVRCVSLLLAVELATDRNQLSRRAVTEDMLATMGNASALSLSLSLYLSPGLRNRYMVCASAPSCSNTATYNELEELKEFGVALPGNLFNKTPSSNGQI
jgi:hypothetical protein